VDVEANYVVVRAYEYTSITSVMLLDCWTIPCVLFLTWIFLKTKYKLGQFIGVGVCVAGLVLVVFSDVHASDRERGSKPILGDMLVLGGSMLYAISNVSEEFFVKNVDRIELMAMLGTFGALIGACQVGVFERNALRSIHWNAHAALPFFGYAVALFAFYVLVPILLKMSGAALLNISLLTSDMWAVLIRIFAYDQKVDWLYFLAFGAVAVGIIIYSSWGEEDNVGDQPKEDALQNNICNKPIDEEANLGNRVEEQLIMAQALREKNGNGHSIATNTLQHEVA
jgi:solute carrier family 35 protein F1/2